MLARLPQNKNSHVNKGDFMSIVKAKNVNYPSHQENLKEEKYTIIREAILATLSDVDGADGLSFTELEHAVGAYVIAKQVPPALFPKPGSIRWYTKAVQLDLEARQLIERVPKRSPMRLRLLPAA